MAKILIGQVKHHLRVCQPLPLDEIGPHQGIEPNVIAEEYLSR